MSGRIVTLEPGRYRLDVDPGFGPAGVHTRTSGDVVVPETGGLVDFTVSALDQAYFWWRGADQPSGVRLVDTPARSAEPAEQMRSWHALTPTPLR